ncbi:MAG: polysaccharide deacetylase family protein [Bacteroidota bacterium]
MENKYRYVLDTFAAIYGVDWRELGIVYGEDVEGKIRIRRGRTSYFEGVTPLAVKDVVEKWWRGRRVLFLFDQAAKDIYTVDAENQTVTINFDILASAFYFLSGWQEYVSEVRDAVARFPYAESFQKHFDCVTRPMVNYYFDILRAAIAEVHDFQPTPKHWGGADFAAFVSHDVDYARTGWRGKAKTELKQGKVLPLLKTVLNRAVGTDPYFNFADIVEMEAELGAKATWFFLCRQGKAFGYTNADYDVTKPRFRRLMDWLEKVGCEVGLHGSFGTGHDGEALKADLQRLGRPAKGNRFHFLQYDVQKSPQILAQNGFQYDSSLGFAEHIGFRNGICYPFFLYDIENDRPLPVLEIPLLVMDATLGFKYMDLEPTEASEQIKALIDEVRKWKGCFSVLWHNDYIARDEPQASKRDYLRILSYCKAEGAAFMTGAQIAAEFQNSDLLEADA